MKLTNWVRDTFIRSVMNEVPEVNITKDEIQQLFVKAMPDMLFAVYQDPELRKCIKTDSISGGKTYHYGIVTGGLEEKEVMKEFHIKQQQRGAVASKLRQTAYGCSTLKQLQVALPDLIHHMPSENAPAKTGLPAIAGLMEDLKKVGFKG